MRTRTRRRLDAALLAGGGLVVGVAGAAGALLGDQERVTQMWVRAELGAEGSAQITEVIDYEFGGTAVDKHGIFRTVPDLPIDAPITVSSDAPDDVSVTPDLGGAKIRIGNPSQTVTGRHRYTIEYPLAGVAVGTRVDWDAVGTEWEVPIEDAEIHLVAPFTLDDIDCFVGSQGSGTACDVRVVEPGHIAVNVEGIDPGEGVSLEGTTGGPVPSPPVAPQPPAPPEDPGAGLLAPAGAAAGAALLGAVPARWAVRRAGRERVAVGGAADAAWATNSPEAERRVDENELAEMVTTEFAPPEGLTPAQGGIILRETVEPEHKVAWLIQEAIDGEIDLVEEDGRAVRLVRTGEDGAVAGDGDGTSARFLQQAFGGRSEVDLGSYDPSFSTAWSSLGYGLDRWRLDSDLWDRRAETRRLAMLVLGVLGVIVGLVAAAAGGAATANWGAGWLPAVAAGAAIAGIGLAMAIGSWELRVRTPKGTAAWLRVESFRRFLAGSEAFHAEEAAKRGVLREYTAWAVATGEIDRWSRAVRASTVIPASAGLSYAYMAPMLIASTSSASTAPSSSGSGRGFSGGVGGGAGGGGGGSW